MLARAQRAGGGVHADSESLIAAETKKLEKLAAAVRREAEVVDRDLFEEALVLGVVGLAEELQAESADLEFLRGRMVRLAR